MQASPKPINILTIFFCLLRRHTIGIVSKGVNGIAYHNICPSMSIFYLTIIWRTKVEGPFSPSPVRSQYKKSYRLLPFFSPKSMRSINENESLPQNSFVSVALNILFFSSLTNRTKEQSAQGVSSPCLIEIVSVGLMSFRSNWIVKSWETELNFAITESL